MSIRASLDSNILVYAELEPETEKGGTAQSVIQAAASRGILAVQAQLEFLTVVRRRRAESLASARAKVDIWSAVFESAPTTTLVAQAALQLVERHKFQVWDAVIWSASRIAGATVFLSEDLQDGLVLDGMRVVNPFTLSDADISKLLGG